ncbi:MAG: DUF4923 family protein [Flavobacteriales bacterium]|nr:DUF4923 family protein [Flavobacteriales bacterium]
MKKIFSLIAVVAMMILSQNAYCQSSLSSLLKNATNMVNSATGNDKATASDMVGTWKFSGTACKLESSDVLKKAAGEVAASTAKEKLDSYCAKYGLTSSSCTFTFVNNGTFKIVTAKGTLNGTYTVDSESNLTLKYTGKTSLSSPSISGKVYKTTSSISILWSADKAVSAFSAISSTLNNATLKTIVSAVNSYDGVLLGIELSK